MCGCYPVSGVKCAYHRNNEQVDVLAGLRAKFAAADKPGVGIVRVTFKDSSTHDFEAIRWEANKMEDGFLVMEDNNHDVRVYHVPNVLFWEVVYY